MIEILSISGLFTGMQLTSWIVKIKRMKASRFLQFANPQTRLGDKRSERITPSQSLVFEFILFQNPGPNNCILTKKRQSTHCK